MRKKIRLSIIDGSDTIKIIRRDSTVDRAGKTLFFDQILAKYGESDWTFTPGYPLLGRILLYEQQIEIVTGTRSEGLYH